MPTCSIPEYEDALKEERRLREEIFLGVNPRICDVEVQHITPRLMVRLNAIRTPFIWGGERSDAEVIRFLWTISPQFVPNGHPDRTARIEEIIATLIKSLGEGKSFVSVEDEIDRMVYETFLDAPTGSAESIPYVTGIAWTIYQMNKDPFRWDKERTLDTPYRELYQYTRCAKLDKGGVLHNEISDKRLADYQLKLREEWMRTKGNN